MSTPDPTRWVHLDLKGMVPGPAAFARWIDRLADAGFGGLVIEYEDRLPWRALPGVHRPALAPGDWRALWDHIARRGLRVAPLVQTIGHLEWVLKHPRYADLRENGHWNELCPSRPESLPLVQALLDEALALHPDCPFVHLGADETWHLADCPACRARSGGTPEGRLAVYLDHVGALCRHVVARGRRPMIWADMLWRTGAAWNGGSLPPETILVDWQYGGVGPWPTTGRLRASGHEVWGASAIRCWFDPRNALAPLGRRVENVAAWNRQLAGGEVTALLHTVWSRPNSLSPLYGPWEGWLPAWLAAGDEAAWINHPLAPLAAEVDAAIAAPDGHDRAPLLARLRGFFHPDPLVADCAAWWTLAVEHRQLAAEAVNIALGHPPYEALRATVGVDPAQQAQRTVARANLRRALDDWEARTAAWLTGHGYSDVPEYLESRLAGARQLAGTVSA